MKKFIMRPLRYVILLKSKYPILDRRCFHALSSKLLKTIFLILKLEHSCQTPSVVADGNSGQFNSNSNELQILNMTLCAMATSVESRQHGG